MNKLFRNAISESAFRRLLAGSVSKGGPEPPAAGGEAGQGRGDMEVWPRQITKALERAVSSVREAAKSVDKLRDVLLDVRLENSRASRAEPQNVEEFRAKWHWFQRVLQKGEERKNGDGVSKDEAGHLLG